MVNLYHDKIQSEELILTFHMLWVSDFRISASGPGPAVCGESEFGVQSPRFRQTWAS
jgi:hypothetical protein